MKKFIVLTFAMSGLAWLSGCADRPERTTTTTTEESTVEHPIAPTQTTTETQTVRPGY